MVTINLHDQLKDYLHMKSLNIPGRIVAAISITLFSLLFTVTMDAQTSTTDAPSATATGFTLLQVDMAVVHMEKMVSFYETMFDAKLTPHDVQSFKLYEGDLLGHHFVFAPNEIAGVVAEQSRHQLEVGVPDIEAVAAKVAAAGGTVRGGVQSDGKEKYLVVEDPDSNTLIFKQKI
jgi:predicted enzyme related to lactoylglutathione lyase